MKGKGLLIGLAVIVVVALVAGRWYVQGVDHVVTLHENVAASWSQVENVLQRRADLIPNLVATVKGFAEQERTVFTEVTRLRSQWGEAKGDRQAQIENANQMSGAIGRLLLVAERYPDLKSNQNFLTLQAQLEGTENRIAVERKRYNEAARAFNTYKRTFFGRFFASRRGLTEPEPYFEASEGAEEVPKVEF
jgi:LemA protein